MLNIKRILQQDRLLRATTGLNQKAFEELLVKFELVYISSTQEREKARQRKRGAGRKAQLRTMKERLFYILFYLKCYPTYDLASVLFAERSLSSISVGTPITTYLRKDIERETSASITKAQ